MIDKRRIITASITLVVAAGAGYLMQNGDAFAAKFATDTTDVNVAAPIDEVFARALPTPPIDSILPGGFSTPAAVGESRVAAAMQATDSLTRTDVPTPKFMISTCEAKLTALPAPGGLVQLKLNAPCHQSQRIVVSHAGLEFSDVTRSDGTYSIAVPALSEYEAFEVSFADGSAEQAKTLMLDLEGYERVAFSWSGDPNIHIHSLENDSDYGEPGHVWAEMSDKSEATAGSLTRFGNPNVYNPILAEVYSVPTGYGQRLVPVEISLEAEVTNASCGKEISGQAVQLTGTSDLSRVDVSLNIPACDGETGYLVLKNLFKDLMIAQN